MPRISYESKRFGDQARVIIARANEVMAKYAGQGLDLTLRQLYYRFVAFDLFPETRRFLWTGTKWLKAAPGDESATKNADPNYKWLGDIINSGRMAGLIDWHYIIDRTRNLERLAHWQDPAELVEIAAKQFRVDLWDSQPRYVEVWIEKDALVGVITAVCEEYDVPYLSCRGYTSQSEMWGASQRILRRLLAGKDVTILHLGDHDPSGIDMTRDIEDRLALFCVSDYARKRFSEAGITDPSEANVQVTANEAMDRLRVNRVALNMDQVEQYEPPPNPAKLTDSRAQSYIAEHGTESWELDALEPRVLQELVRENIEALIEDGPWEAAREREDDGQKLLRQVSQEWDSLTADLNGSAE